MLHTAVLLLAVFTTTCIASESTWSEWGPWNGECSVCPNARAKSRSRFCIPGVDGSNAPCLGSHVELEACGVCPSEASWTEWGTLGKCSSPCGACGRRYRERYCVQPPGCPIVPCRGEQRSLEVTDVPCDNQDLCYFPYTSCCEGYNKTVTEGRFACLKP